MNKVVMITGANAGIGKEAARQLASKKETEKVILAVRNKAKGEAAREELEKSTKRKIFEVLVMDVSKPESVKIAVDSLNEPIDALIMNAGGMGGKEPEAKTAEGVTSIFAANVLGHVILTEKLIEDGKLNNVAMYASSEGVRGVKKMGMKPAEMENATVEEFKSVFDGSYFGENPDGMVMYVYVKYAASLWMSAMARKHPNIRFISMSPGATSGTNVMNDLPFFQRMMFKYIGFPVLMPLMGMVHKVEKGAARYVQAINDSSLTNGAFYASKEGKLTGPVVDQSSFFPSIGNQTYQDNADKAIHAFV